MDGGAWWASVHGVTKSRTRLSDFTFTFHFHALEKEMATHSSVLAWRIPGTGKPEGLPSLGLHRVGHNWSDLAVAAAVAACFYEWKTIFFKTGKFMKSDIICWLPGLQSTAQHWSWLLKISLKPKSFCCSFKGRKCPMEKKKQTSFTSNSLKNNKPLYT